MKRITACSILCTVLASPGCGLVGSQVREVSPAPVGSGSSLETSANASEVSEYEDEKEVTFVNSIGE